MFVLNNDQNFAQFSVVRHLFILWQEFANGISHRKLVVTDDYAAHILLSTGNFSRALILAVYLVKSPALLDKAAGGPH
jgi:hypothetical protein